MRVFIAGATGATGAIGQYLGPRYPSWRDAFPFWAKTAVQTSAA